MATNTTHQPHQVRYCVADDQHTENGRRVIGCRLSQEFESPSLADQALTALSPRFEGAYLLEIIKFR